MYYRCRLGSFGDSSTASRSNDPGGTVDSNYNQAIGTLFFLIAVLFLILTLSCVPSYVSLPYFNHALPIRK